MIDAALASAGAPAGEPPAPPRWTLKRLVEWVKEHLGRCLSRESLRRALHRLGYSWKKAKKLLNRADPDQRESFLGQLSERLEQVLHHSEPLLVYLDEAHIHEDADPGYGWAKGGEPFWIGSHSPRLAARVSFYGVYVYNDARVHLWPFAQANAEHTVTVLERLRASYPDRPLTLIWDGASYHRSATVRECAEALGIELLPLPGYSPDFMPVEHLWSWLREEVTYHHCHADQEELIERVAAFEAQINQDPGQVADRLWVQNHLDPAVEKLRVPR